MELKCEFNKVTRYKVKNTKYQLYFFHISKNQLGHKTKAILFTRAWKKHQTLSNKCNERYWRAVYIKLKILQKEIKDDLSACRNKVFIDWKK